MRRLKTLTSTKLAQLKIKQIKKRTFSKMQWGVRAYCDWRSQRLSDVINFDVKIDEADLLNVQKLCPNAFIHSMCRFIPEVTKVRDGSDYPGKTLYEMVTCIQKYLHENGKYWKLLDDMYFNEIRTVLDNVMKERALNNIGTTVRQAGYITVDHENLLWEKGILGEDSPDKLRETVLFLLGINLGLRAGDEHHALRRNCSEKPSQISFERASNGQRCLVYREDTVTKTNDGGLSNLKKERKIIWVYPSDNINRCPVRIVDKYMSLIPDVKPKTKKYNFYLRSLEKPNPAQWYGEQVVGRHTLTKVVGKLLQKANLGGFYSNHSLRRSGTTRLFQAGVDRKIVKEYTGHVSDAVDKYQVTSDAQKKQLSEIIGGCKDGVTEKTVKLQESDLELKVTDKGMKEIGCSCAKKTVKVDKSDQLGTVISDLLKARNGGKAVVRIEIEFSD